jgi:chemotaxis protein MotB
MKTHFTWILTGLLLTSCVSVQRFDEKQAELDACRNQAQQDKQDSLSRLTALQEQLKTVSRDRDACHEKYEKVVTTAQTLEQRAEALRRSLQDEIRTRDVEIETLKGKLTVRMLDRILFKTGSARILPAGEAVLAKLGKVLTTTREYIRVEGHTDIVPISQRLKSKYYSNWELSAARAASVVRYLQNVQKIDPLRLEAVGFSKYRPVTTGKTTQDLQRNRRVEIVLSEVPLRPDEDN